MSFPLEPLNGRVIVRPDDPEEVTPGGIVLPQNSQEQKMRGRVVAVGEGRMLETGARTTMTLAVGDEVVYSKFGGSNVEVDGHEHRIIEEDEILARVTPS